MSIEAVSQVIDRAVKDRQFCELLAKDPRQALARYELTAEEREALLAGDAEGLEALGLDRRTSKWQLYTQQLATFGGW